MQCWAISQKYMNASVLGMLQENVSSFLLLLLFSLGLLGGCPKQVNSLEKTHLCFVVRAGKWKGTVCMNPKVYWSVVVIGVLELEGDGRMTTLLWLIRSCRYWICMKARLEGKAAVVLRMAWHGRSADWSWTFSSGRGDRWFCYV